MVGGAVSRSAAVLGVHTLATRLVIHVSAFVASVLIAHALGPGGTGRYTVAMTVGTVASLLSSLGFEQAQAKAWSSGTTTRESLFGTALAVAATTGLAATGVLLAFWSWEREDILAGVGLPAVVLVAALIPVRVLVAMLRGLLIVGGHTERSNVGLVLGDIARTVVIAALALAAAISVETVLAAFWLTMLVPLVMYVRTVGRPLRPSATALRAHLRAGTALSPYFVFLFLNLRLDVLLLAKLADSRAVGLYAVAVTFAELVWLVTDAVTTGARERLWGTSADDARTITAAAARVSLLLALVVLPFLALGAPVALRLFFGDEFAGATMALWGLLPAAAAMAWWRALSGALVRFGQPSAVNGVALAALAVNVGLNLWLIPELGIGGAAVASLGSYTVGVLLTMVALSRHGIGPGQLVPRRDDVQRLRALVRQGLDRVRPVRQRG